jgi:glycosyltransferase involved in cell wall biosynthesis
LGVFGATAKAGRVIPNKVFQALACGKPVVTRRSPAYPEDVADRPGKGLIWVDGGDARGLADAVVGLAGPPGRLGQIGREARATFESHFSETAIGKSLADALATLPEPAR